METKMSTVDKTTADRVIAGDFPEDGIYAILRYENAFNGNYAYKLMYDVSGYLDVGDKIIEIANMSRRIRTNAPVAIYWVEDDLKGLIED